MQAGFFARLMQANETFRAGLPGTLRRLQDVRAGLDPAAPAADLVAELGALLHTLAGAAATFGFREMGQGARSLEQRLRVLTAFDHVGAGDWSAWLAGVEQFAQAGLAGSRSA
ncbi:hypothetical protein G4G28_11580 [Massilia sp. Dwa41.01b]|uniref:Hpt domain-containing protein n=1 Tax=Massilia sp. Dwa41.01b TaxID=2709302 RepID=UPI001600AB73|nr:Hpt domain-containing protein [Massilia sp. Dwa41.01b]QNA88962.1 hypothetical protein G4G28_11580 [Massilia sp. Dwa41.01b]